MTNLSTPPHWEALIASANRIETTPSLMLLQDHTRNSALRLATGGCRFDFTRQRVDQQILGELLALAEKTQVFAKRDAMFAGETINTSENRQVLHPALRDGAPKAPAPLRAQVQATKGQLYELVESIRSGRYTGYTDKAIRDVVHIGIGGSHLGPELAVTALGKPSSKGTAALGTDSSPNIHFVANVDARDIALTLAGLNPETTLFIVVSKSFGTLETQLNATTARSWFLERTGNIEAIGQHFVGVTANVELAKKFGLNEERIYPLWDWVGGRFSLWSAVGLPIMLKLGTEAFEEFLAGARNADEHFLKASPAENIPLIAALLATWNTVALSCDSLAMLSYDQRLALLPDYLQQLEMESNGKSVSVNDEPLPYRTMQILWGGCGTNGQHAYHQLLHQGTSRFAADFILVGQDDLHRPEHHQWLLANGFAQGQAMTLGTQPEAKDQAHKRVLGQHPSTTILLDELGPEQLGCLLAVYEHKVFCQGVLWNINSFDQWGVELGKQLALPIFAQMHGKDASDQDPATRHLIDYYRSLRPADS